MSYWNAKYTNALGEYEITFASKSYEKTKVIEKVCQAVLDDRIQSVEDLNKSMLVQQYIKVPEKPKWISVEDRLPQETGEVCEVVNLMMDNGLVTAGWINDITRLGYFLDSKSSFIRQAPLSRFVAWMPLPKEDT